MEKENRTAKLLKIGLWACCSRPVGLIHASVHFFSNIYFYVKRYGTKLWYYTKKR
mgnify:CR=1 FL=1